MSPRDADPGGPRRPGEHAGLADGTHADDGPDARDDGRDTADDGLDALFDAEAAATLRAHWAERGLTVRAQAEPWRRSGHSGARLGLVVLGHPDRPDERVVVKVLPAGPDTRETDRHHRAVAAAPDFTAAHVVAQAHPPHDLPGRRRAMYQKLPPATGEVMPLGAALNGELAAPCARLAASLLDGWNPGRSLLPTTVGRYLATELRSALEPGRSARAWAREILMTDVADPTDAETGRWIRDEDEPGVILPNPARITEPGHPIGELPLDHFAGSAHGDLHLENVLVEHRDGRPVAGRHWLIDLAHYADGVPLSRDIAALVLALVRRRVADLPAGASGEARALIDAVVDPSGTAGPGIGAGVVDAIRAVDDACRAALPGDREVWRAQYLWSVVAEALVHTSYEATGERVRWWCSRLAAHAARAALDEARRRAPAGTDPPLEPVAGAIPLVGPRTAAARRAPRRALRTRDEVVASVRGRSLVPDELPFFSKAPARTPDALVPPVRGDRLPSGVALLGAAGAGKSRWCLEAAARAEEAGSPVRFLGGIDGGSAEPLPLSTEELVTELADALAGTPAARTALLVIDGLDRFPGLDLPGLHDALVELAYQGRPVAVLATSRHGTHWNSQLARGAAALLPAEQHLPSDPAYRRPLLRSVLRRSAPRTVGALGAVAVLAALRNDPEKPLAPGVAAMWSGVLERATRTTATTPAPAGRPARPGARPAGSGGHPALREETLPEALHRALQGVPGDPETAGRLVLLPAAAVLASAPLPYDRLLTVADTALSEAARALKRPAPCAGEDVIRCLRETGLLHLDPTPAGTPGTLVVSHPLACDAFLEYATGCGAEGTGTGLLLGVAARDMSAFANTAASVTRWYPLASRETRDRFDEQAALWLYEHAATLGRAVTTADPGGASVLEFLLFTRPWHKLTYTYWSSLAGPWFQRPEASRVDPLLLARALYEDRNEVRERIVDLALGWLERHAREPVAAQVLRWLLRRHETRDARRDQALRLADTFLEANPQVRPNHVLAAALVQHAEVPERTGPLAERALAELREAPGAETNGPLLGALLSRRDIDERVLEGALELARAHMAHNPLAPTSNEVLKWLLLRTELPAADHRAAMTAADAWLAVNATHPHAAHVLSGVLLDRRSTESRLREAASLAVDWLETNERRRPAIWVLTDLMEAHERFERIHGTGQPLLPDDLRPRLAAVTVPWLRQWAWEAVTPSTAARVLRLTHRTTAGTALARALLTWVRAKEHSGQPKAFPVLIAVLDVSGPGRALGAETVGPALKWLRTHHRRETAGGVLQKLLQLEDLRGDEARTAYTYALAWLDGHRDRHTTDTHVARWLLLAFKRQPPAAGQLAAAVDHVIALLDRLKAAGSTRVSLHVHLPMLRAALEQQPDPERTGRLLTHAKWLLDHQDLGGQRGMLFQSLLGPRDLPEDFVTEVIDEALGWLDASAGTEQAGFALKGLVRRREAAAGSDAHARLCAAARVWLDAHPGHPEAGSLAGLLLDRNDVDPATGRAAVDAGTAWLLSTAPAVDKAAPLLARLLPLAPPDDGRAVAFALRLLAEHPPWRRAMQILGGLLCCRGLGAGESDRVRQQALLLVADHQYDWEAGRVLQRLLERDDLDARQERDAMEHARGWWHQHHRLASAPYLAEAMFAHDEHLRRRLGDRDWRTRIVDDLVDWLGAEPLGKPNEGRGSLPTAVRLVKDHPRLSAVQKAEIAERVAHWLTARPDDAGGRELAGWAVTLVDDANRSDPFGAGVAVAPDTLARIRAVASGAPPRPRTGQPPRPEPDHGAGDGAGSGADRGR
ncbi:hypothetical protein [Streptomyces poriticola]|uniref:hypothetical protein n=1 Tax=Streptomyces poriticola TaxID=3120506 RepID=UPI002FCE07D8